MAANDIYLYTNATSVANAVITSQTVTTAASFPDLVLGDSPTYNFYFTDGTASWPSFAGNAQYSVEWALGTTSADDSAVLAYQTTATAITGGWSLRLPLNTGAVLNQLNNARVSQEYPVVRVWQQIRVTDPSGYKTTYATIRTNLRLRTAPTDQILPNDPLPSGYQHVLTDSAGVLVSPSNFFSVNQSQTDSDLAAEILTRESFGNTAFTVENAFYYTSSTVIAAATGTSSTAQGASFCGWGAKYEKTGQSWNAVKIHTVSRTATLKTTEQWTTAHVEVRHCTGAGNGGISTLIAVGELDVDPDSDTLSNIIVALRSPSTNDLITLNDASLTEPFFVGYYFTNSAGTAAASGEANGTVATAEGNSFYLTPPNLATKAWADNFGDSPIAIEQILLAGITSGDAPVALKNAMLPDGVKVEFPYCTMPDRVYGLANVETSIYFRNLFERPDDFLLDVACNVGQQQSERWTVNSNAAVNTTVTITAYDKAYQNIGNTSASLYIAAATAGGGATRNCIFIGDSTTEDGVYTAEIANYSTADANLDITLLGTNGSGANKFEGRGGWSIGRYYAPGVTYYADNPFVVPAQSPSGVFNFAHYISNTSISLSSNDWVIFNLGINDTFNFTTDAEIDTVCDTAFAQLELMIANVQAAVTGIRVGVAVPVPPSASQDAFGASYQCGQTRWRFLRNLFVFSDRLIRQFKARTSSKIYVVPINLNLDTLYNASYAASAPVNSRTTTEITRQNNGVHPATAGYLQVADSIWAFLKFYA